MKGLASNSKSKWGRAGENWKIIATRVTGWQPGTPQVGSWQIKTRKQPLGWNWPWNWGPAHSGFKVNTLASREDTVSAKGDRSCLSFRMVLPQSSGHPVVMKQEDRLKSGALAGQGSFFLLPLPGCVSPSPRQSLSFNEPQSPHLWNTVNETALRVAKGVTKNEYTEHSIRLAIWEEDRVWGGRSLSSPSLRGSHRLISQPVGPRMPLGIGGREALTGWENTGGLNLVDQRKTPSDSVSAPREHSVSYLARCLTTS